MFRNFKNAQNFRTMFRNFKNAQNFQKGFINFQEYSQLSKFHRTFKNDWTFEKLGKVQEGLNS